MSHLCGLSCQTPYTAYSWTSWCLLEDSETKIPEALPSLIQFSNLHWSPFHFRYMSFQPCSSCRPYHQLLSSSFLFSVLHYSYVLSDQTTLHTFPFPLLIITVWLSVRIHSYSLWILLSHCALCTRTWAILKFIRMLPSNLACLSSCFAQFPPKISKYLFYMRWTSLHGKFCLSIICSRKARLRM